MLRRPTVSQVAHAAGVSRQTVSNTLNSPERVRPDTRQRVLDAVERLGYRTNSAARQLRTRRAQVLGLCLPSEVDGINGHILDRFLHALTTAAARRAYRVMLFTASDDQSEIAAYSDLLESAGVDGFVLTSTHHDDARTAWLSAQHVPFVTFGRPWDQLDADDGVHPWVDVNGRAGTREATSHAFRAGHRQVAFLGWPAGSGSGDDRAAGWRKGHEDNGRVASPLLERRVADGVGEGAAAATELIDNGADAIICASDSLALGAFSVASARARPPLVIGYDNTPVAQAIGLSSISQPISACAEHCLDLVLKQVGGADATGEHKLIDPVLKLRGEVAMVRH